MNEIIGSAILAPRRAERPLDCGTVDLAARPLPRAGIGALTTSVGDGRHRVDLLGVLIDCVGVAEARRRLEAYLSSQRLHHVVTVNLDFLRIAQADVAFRDLLNAADLAVADGMPLVWASRLGDNRLPQRVTGNALVEECCQVAATTGKSLFLVGGRPGIAEEAARTIQRRYPGAVVAGVYAPPFGPLSARDDRQIVDRVNRSGARILFVAFGAPRQEKWIHAHRHELDVGVALGVGCALDVLAGAVPRAPRWMQQTGLEWLHRLSVEPRRLWHRYLIDDPPIFASLMLESLRAGSIGSDVE